MQLFTFFRRSFLGFRKRNKPHDILVARTSTFVAKARSVTLPNTLVATSGSQALLAQGEVTPIGAVSRAATGVKMRSNGQAACWGTIYGTRLVTTVLYWRSRGVVDPFAHAQFIDGQGSRAKIRRGRSKILVSLA